MCSTAVDSSTFACTSAMTDGSLLSTASSTTVTQRPCNINTSTHSQMTYSFVWSYEMNLACQSLQTLARDSMTYASSLPVEQNHRLAPSCTAVSIFLQQLYLKPLVHICSPDLCVLPMQQCRANCSRHFFSTSVKSGSMFSVCLLYTSDAADE